MKMTNLHFKQDLVFAVCLITLGVLTRTVLHLGANIEFVTALSLCAGYFMREKKAAFLVPFVVMVITDMILGNTVIYLFTWSAFLAAPLIGMVQKYLENKYPALRTFATPAVSSSIFVLFFFLWTNLGVVMTTNMYTKDFAGIMHSYFNALPFLKPQMLGNIVVSPLLFVACRLMLRNQPTALQLTKKNYLR